MRVSFASVNRPFLVLTLLLSLVAALVAPRPATAAPATIAIEVSGLDDVAVGQPAPIVVDVDVSDPGDITADTPLRLVLSLTDAGGAPIPGATLSADGEALAIDGAGTAVYPPLDGAPVSLDTDGDGGHALPTALSFDFELLIPDEIDARLRADLVVSNERASSAFRYAGDDRIATSIAISRANFNPGVATLYLSRADNYPDALAAGAVAGRDDAPILLVHTDSIPEAVQDEILRLAPDRIVLLGGTTAISEAVEDALRALTDAAVRRVEGPDRYATAAALALASFTAPVAVVYVATGENFADALSGGPAAAGAGAAILLTARDSLPAATAAALRDLQPGRIVVLGGPAAVSDAVVAQLETLTAGGVIRLQGEDRYETSAMISADSADPDLVTTIYLATGTNFPDALSGVPAAAGDGAPILLVRPDGIPASILAEIQRLNPARVIVLGGTAAVVDSVLDAAATHTRTVGPSPARFRSVATSGPRPVFPIAAFALISPTADGPLALRPRDRFNVEFTTPRAGTYTLEYRAGTSAWREFDNPRSAGAAASGLRRIGLNAPFEDGVYDLRLTHTPVSGPAQSVTLDDIFTVALTFPPPLITSLIEGLDDQSQLVVVRPAPTEDNPFGGLAEGVRLDVDLSSAERSGADYPTDGAVTVLGGTGSAVLVVQRDGLARIEYTAGPLDNVGGPPPLLKFRIDAIDVDEAHGAHVGGFFRYDINHGVSRVFHVGDGGQIASPTVTDFQSGNPHGFQVATFALVQPMAPYETVTIDLGAAERGPVTYQYAFAVLQGGGGHGTPAAVPASVSPAFEPEPELGWADLYADPGLGAEVVFTAGPEGVPSVNGEGPKLSIFVGGIEAEDVRATLPVTFTRSDDPSVATTEFSLQAMGLVNATASGLASDAAGLSQTLSVDLDGGLGQGQEIAIDLSGAARSGVDYLSATVTVLGGVGTAEVEVYDDSYFGAQAAVRFVAGANHADGSTISVRIDGIDTPDADTSHVARFWRFDSYAAADALFDVGDGGPLADALVSDLEAGQSNAWQSVQFTAPVDLAPGSVVTVDLGAAEVAAADYDADSFWFYDGGEEEGAEAGEVSFDVVADVGATLTYTVSASGLPAGRTVYVDVYDVDVADVLETYEAVFARTGDVREARTSFSTRRFPGLRDLAVSDLASGTLGQIQTIDMTASLDLPEDVGVEIYLAGAEFGGGRYGGAEAVVTSGSGTATLWTWPGEYASVTYTAGPGGDLDGEVISIELRGVNTDAVHETHVAEFWRYDGFNSYRVLFDIGDGGPFVGVPTISDLYANSTYEWQYAQVALNRDLLPGQEVTIDVSEAEAGPVSYTPAILDHWGTDGTAELVVVEGVSAVITYTAGPSGVPLGETLWFEMYDIAVGNDSGEFNTVFTDVAGGHVANRRFTVWGDGGHFAYRSAAGGRVTGKR